MFGLKGILFVHSVGDLQRVPLHVCTLVLLDNAGVVLFTLAFIFSEVFAHRSVAVIAVARLSNQILFIASRLFQHIRIMINREMGVV